VALASASTDTDAAIRKAAAKVTFLEQKVAATEAEMGRINPALEPVSDKKFFDGHRSDYPTDERPVMKEPFRSPFPILQSSNEYDRDFVKDENNDKGYWSAQMKYDGLRVRVPKLKELIAKAQAKAKEEEMEEEAAIDKEADAHKAANAAEAANEDAKIEEDEAEAAANDSDAGVSEQGETVEREVKELEECKRRLAATKKKLADIAAKNPVEAAVAEENAQEKERQERREIQEGQKSEESKKRVEEESKKTVEEVQADIEQTEKELEAAAERLRKKRAEQAAQYGHDVRRSEAPCPKGCEKIGQKSGAALPGAITGLSISAMVALWSAAA